MAGRLLDLAELPPGIRLEPLVAVSVAVTLARSASPDTRLASSPFASAAATTLQSGSLSPFRKERRKGDAITDPCTAHDNCTLHQGLCAASYGGNHHSCSGAFTTYAYKLLCVLPPGKIVIRQSTDLQIARDRRHFSGFKILIN